MLNLFFYRHNKKGYAHDISPTEINFFELTLVLKGELEYEVGGKTVTIKQNDGIFIEAGSIRRRKSTEGVDYVSFNFYGFDSKLPLLLPNVLTNSINLLIAVCDEIHEKIYDGDNEMSLAFNLILSIINKNVNAARENPAIIAIKQYIHSNLTDRISLPELAKNVGYSPNYCAALFKKHTGFSIVEYLVNERVEEAKKLISENILSLQQIAEAVGFEDYNYFSRTFKKTSGYSPTDYKRLVHQK